MSTPFVVKTAPSSISSWQAAYLRYRKLEQQLTEAKSSGPLFLLRASAKGRQKFDQNLNDYLEVQQGTNEGHLPALKTDLLDELGTFADLKSSYNSDEKGFIFENVYHCAFHHLILWRHYGIPVASAQNCARIYRGQNQDNREVQSPIFRSLEEQADPFADLRQRAILACRIGHAIAQKLDLSFADAMAVAQHYSEKLGVRTWLNDFTRDPWVALFFASDRIKPNTIGIVWDILLSEYETYSRGIGNPIGPLQLIVPPNVRRIENQAGVFIVGAHPDMFKQYVPFGWDVRFRQVSELTFEDPFMGVCKNTIYPSDDPLQGMISEVQKIVMDCGCKVGQSNCKIPVSVLASSTDPSSYESILISWLNDLQDRDTADLTEVRAALPDLARFHALLQSPAYAKRLSSIVSRSFNRLHKALEELYFGKLQNQHVDVYEAIKRSYFLHMSHDQEYINIFKEAALELKLH